MTAEKLIISMPATIEYVMRLSIFLLLQNDKIRLTRYALSIAITITSMAIYPIKMAAHPNLDGIDGMTF